MLYERTGLSTNKDVVLKNPINGKDLNQMRFFDYDDCDMILDAGCGTGRNLLYLLKSGANVFGIDQNPEAIAQLRTRYGTSKILIFRV